MRRRIFVMVLAGAAAYPLLAGAQQKEMPGSASLAAGRQVRLPRFWRLSVKGWNKQAT